MINLPEPVDLQEGCGFFCITFVLATVGGLGGSSWSSNVFFLWSRREREAIIDSAAERAPRCVQSLLLAVLHPRAT